MRLPRTFPLCGLGLVGLASGDCVLSGNVCVMSTAVLERLHIEPGSKLCSDSPEDIAEMMAEAARVDAMFQSMTISTLLPTALALHWAPYPENVRQPTN
jgi:hypothetical protein